MRAPKARTIAPLIPRWSAANVSTRLVLVLEKTLWVLRFAPILVDRITDSPKVFETLIISVPALINQKFLVD